MSAFSVEAWLQVLSLELDAAGARLSCPTAFHRERVRERYLPLIERQLEAELGRRVPVTLTVDCAATGAAQGGPAAAQGDPAGAAGPRAQRNEGTPAPRPNPTPTPTRSGPARSPARKATASRTLLQGVKSAPTGHCNTPPGSPQRAQPEQIHLPYTFDSFVVGPCNALAREASVAVAQDRQQRANPLFLTSEPGLGKTPLARAIVEEARTAGRERIVYASAETFTNHFMTSLRSKQMDRFKRRYRYNDLLVVEDVQFLSAKKATQLELFHTLLHLLDAGARVVLTADRLPRDLEKVDSRLCSQMSAGLVAEIEPPDARVRRLILRTKAASGGVRLPEDCLDLLVDIVRGNLRDLTGVLVQLVASASLLSRPIDLELTEAALRKVAPERQRAKHLAAGDVIDCVAAFFGTSADALASRSRRHDVLHPRQIAMYLCRRYTDATLGAIAKHFRRDHPAVSNAIRAVERRLLERPKLRYQIEELTGRLDALEKKA